MLAFLFPAVRKNEDRFHCLSTAYHTLGGKKTMLSFCLLLMNSDVHQG